MTSPAFDRKLRQAKRLADPNRVPLEAEDQIKLVAKLRLAGVLCFHVPNERKPNELSPRLPEAPALRRRPDHAATTLTEGAPAVRGFCRAAGLPCIARSFGVFNLEGIFSR